VDAKNQAAADELTRAVLACSLPAETRLLVAVSGGPDSVALLATVWRAMADQQWEVRAGHVNHTLRGEESEADEHFVRRLCDQLSVPLEVARVETAAEAARRRLGIETAARELRYRELLVMLAAWPGDLLLTAHTADDQAETLVMRLLRGAGLEGLGGVRIRAGQVLRPFLAVRHETVLAALQEMQLGYRLDSSNQDRRFSRNRIRADVLPVLERESPHAVDALTRAAALLQGDAAYLAAETSETCRHLRIAWSDQEVAGDAALWRALHRSLQRSMLRAATTHLTAQGLDAPSIERAADHIEACRQGPMRQVPLASGLMLCCDRDRFVIHRGKRRIGEHPSAVRLVVPGEAPGPGGRLTAEFLSVDELVERDRLIAVCGPLHALCDADQVGAQLMLRTRQPGDRLRPLGMEGSKKLQDILVDRHVPAARRDDIPVVADEQGLLWIPGFALDRRAAVTAATTRVLHLRLTPSPGGYHDRMPRQS
jgi:tRNA(Ile)-lysidine synthase